MSLPLSSTIFILFTFHSECLVAATGAASVFEVGLKESSSSAFSGMSSSSLEPDPENSASDSEISDSSSASAVSLTTLGFFSLMTLGFLSFCWRLEGVWVCRT